MVHSPEIDPYTRQRRPGTSRLRLAWTLIVLGLAFAVVAACVVVLWG